MCHGKKHEASRSHQKAVQKLASGCNAEDVEEEIKNLPVMELALRKVWDDTKKGIAFVGMVSDAVGSRNKIVRLTQCLGEAGKVLDQDAVRASWVMALQQDVRN